MPAAAVDAYLTAAIDAACGLGDAALLAAIEKLERDGSPVVAGRAREAMRSHAEKAAGPPVAAKSGGVS